MILVTGASGFLGQGLLTKLKEMNIPYRTLSAKQNKIDKINNFYWDYLNEIDIAAFDGVDTIINLAGENIGEGYWTTAKKKRILESRINTGRLLKRTIVENNFPVKKFISASAIGIYPSDYSVLQNEDSPSGEGFLADVCKSWEKEVLDLKNHGIEFCILRIGVVLGEGGGMMAQLKLPMMFRLLPVLGNGKQWVSWIHQQDVVNAFAAAATKPDMKGIYNLVAPEPVTMKQLVKAIAGDRFFLKLPVPAFLLKLVLGEKAIIVTNSQKVSSQKLLDSGFNFNYPDISKVDFT